MQIGSFQDLVNAEKNVSDLSRLNRLVFGQCASRLSASGSPPASGYGAILKGAAAHTPGLPAASLVCLTFCQHHVNEGPVSVHSSHTGVPFNEFAI